MGLGVVVAQRELLLVVNPGSAASQQESGKNGQAEHTRAVAAMHVWSHRPSARKAIWNDCGIPRAVPALGLEAILDLEQA